ncbi:hypothetical protein ABPG74_006611 [Tetrahymena malaccensis]
MNFSYQEFFNKAEKQKLADMFLSFLGQVQQMQQSNNKNDSLLEEILCKTRSQTKKAKKAISKQIVKKSKQQQFKQEEFKQTYLDKYYQKQNNEIEKINSKLEINATRYSKLTKKFKIVKQVEDAVKQNSPQDEQCELNLKENCISQEVQELSQEVLYLEQIDQVQQKTKHDIIEDAKQTYEQAKPIPPQEQHNINQIEEALYNFNQQPKADVIELKVEKIKTVDKYVQCEVNLTEQEPLEINCQPKTQNSQIIVEIEHQFEKEKIIHEQIECEINQNQQVPQILDLLPQTNIAEKVQIVKNIDKEVQCEIELNEMIDKIQENIKRQIEEQKQNTYNNNNNLVINISCEDALLCQKVMYKVSQLTKKQQKKQQSIKNVLN